MDSYAERKKRELRERIEDTFVDVAEAGIKAGLSFEKAMERHPEYTGGPYGEWKRKYEEWAKIAIRPEFFTLAGERQRLKSERHKAAQAAVESAFYESNKLLFEGAAEEKMSFEQASRRYGWSADLKPYYQKAFATVWGRHAEMPQGDSTEEAFLAGFMSD